MPALELTQFELNLLVDLIDLLGDEAAA